MTKNSMDGLTIRRLKSKDAQLYMNIADGEALRRYVYFFRATTLSQAEKIIQKNNRYDQALYGLFVRRVGLVAVFSVSPNYQDGAEIEYFTGCQYYGRGYAGKGIQLLAEKLCQSFDYFLFHIYEDNLASLAVQKKLLSKEILFSEDSWRTFIYSLK